MKSKRNMTAIQLEQSTVDILTFEDIDTAFLKRLRPANISRSPDAGNGALQQLAEDMAIRHAIYGRGDTLPTER